MTVYGGGGVSGGAAAAETSPIISWLSKQQQKFPTSLMDSPQGKIATK